MDGNGRLAGEEEEVQGNWMNYFVNLYNEDTKEQIAIRMCSFGDVQKDNYFGGEPVKRVKMELRVGELRN